jgi:hypothetical protein
MKKPRFLSVHRRDLNNVGDMASAPLQYFLKPDEYQVIDTSDLAQARYDTNLPMIIGGGGLLANHTIGEITESVLSTPDRNQLRDIADIQWSVKNPRFRDLARNLHDGLQNLVARTLEKIPYNHTPRYIWGAGHNNSDSTTAEKIKYHRYLSEYRLVGLRDWHGGASRYAWIPCASCLHPAFNKKYTVKNDVIWFEHKKRLIKDFGNDSIPRFVNSGSNIEQTIELLASANIILTNSYHGAYWGTLLGRRVVVVEPWSSKFFHMRHPPVLLTNRRMTWKAAAEQAEIYPDALDVSRYANQQFWLDLQRDLEQPNKKQEPAKENKSPTPLQLSLWKDPK